MGMITPDGFRADSYSGDPIDWEAIANEFLSKANWNDPSAIISGDSRWPKKDVLAVNASDYSSPSAAVVAAMASGSEIYWPAGTFLATTNIPNIHNVKHSGSGKIVRDSTTFYLNPHGSQSNTIYVSPTGDDYNDGLTSTFPVKTFQKAFDILANYGPILDGFWSVVAAAGTYPYPGKQSTQNTRSINWVTVQGPNVGSSPNVPTAIIDGTGGGTYAHGLSASGIGVRVEFKNLKFTNFSAGVGDSTRVGCLGENESDLLTNNVHADGCSWCGIYAFNTVRARIYGGIHTNCRSGIATNTTQATIGGANDKQVYIRNSTQSGIYWSRGTQGHIDYVTFEDNPIGLNVLQDSRVDTVANVYKRNTIAIQTQSGGYWGEGGLPNTYGTGADANTTVFDIHAYSGNSDDLNRAETWARMAYDRTTRTHTGTTATTVIATPYTVPAFRMMGVGKSLRIVASGIYTVTAGTAILVNIGGMALSLTVPGALTGGAFEIDVTLMEVQGGYRAFGKLTAGFTSVRFGSSGSGFSNSVDQAVSVGATLAATTDTISIYRTDVYILG